MFYSADQLTALLTSLKNQANPTKSDQIENNANEKENSNPQQNPPSPESAKINSSQSLESLTGSIAALANSNPSSLHALQSVINQVLASKQMTQQSKPPQPQVPNLPQLALAQQAMQLKLKNLPLMQQLSQQQSFFNNPRPSISSNIMMPDSPPGMSDAKRRRRHRTVFSDKQLSTLETLFHQTQYPDVATRERLARTLDLEEERVEVWFKNRRAKFRRQQREGGGLAELQNSETEERRSSPTQVSQQILQNISLQNIMNQVKPQAGQNLGMLDLLLQEQVQQQTQQVLASKLIEQQLQKQNPMAEILEKLKTQQESAVLEKQVKNETDDKESQ